MTAVLGDVPGDISTDMNYWNSESSSEVDALEDIPDAHAVRSNY